MTQPPPPPDAPVSLRPGAVLDGRFRLERLLGRGGMGAVYQALDVPSGRQVAIKTVTGELSAMRLERFEREGRITASLRHPGIVALHSAGQAGGRPYLVYELVEGARELGAVLPGLSRDERVALLRDAARAVGHAHAQGVTHRDVKLENLLVDADGQLRVADFGLANAAGDERLTRTGALIGTPHYMAPEQLEGDTGPHTDVWALGVLLYLALTDDMPFEGDSLPQILVAIQAGARPPRGLDPTISRDLERVVLRALSPRKQDRYPEAKALAADLDACLAGQPLAHRGGGVLVILGALALVIAGAGALAHQTFRPAPASAVPPPVPSISAPAALAPEELAEAEGELRRLELGSEAPAVERLSRYDAWLERWAAHPRADQARARRRALSLEAPWRYDGLVPEDGSARRVYPLCAERSLFCFSGKTALELELSASGRGVRELRRFALPTRVDSVLRAPDGGFLVSASQTVTYVSEDGTRSRTLLTLSSPEATDLMALWKGPRGLALVVADETRLLAYPLTLGAQPATGEPQLLADYLQRVYTLATSADRQQLAVSVPGKPPLLELRGPRPRTWHGTPAESSASALAFSPDGRSLVSGHDNGIVLLHDLERDQPPRPFKDEDDEGYPMQGVPVAHVGGLRQAFFTPDGERLITASRLATLEPTSAIKVWEVATGQVLRALQPAGDIESLDLDPAQRRLATSFKDGHVMVWELE